MRTEGLTAQPRWTLLRSWTPRATALAAVLLVGLSLRIVPPLVSDFPLADGGMFLAMARDVAGNGWALPAVTTYNDAAIPFAYPPLALYLLALFPDHDALRWMPALWAALSLIAFGWLVVQNPRFGGLASLAIFAASTPAFGWLVAGGGVTRGLGFGLALTAAGLALQPGRPFRLIAGLVTGLAALAHPEAAVFAGISITVLLWPAWRSIATIGVIGLVIVLPWLTVVLVTHGPDPLVAAMSSHRSSLLDLSGVLPTGMPLTAPATVVGFAGLLHAAVQRHWRHLSWAVLVGLALPLPDYLQAATYSVFAGRFVIDVVSSLVARRIVVTVAVVVGTAATVVAIGEPPFLAVPKEDRQILADFATLPADTTIAVDTDCEWAEDYVNEWAPVLADRRISTTVQGVEWLGPEAAQRILDERSDPSADLIFRPTARC